MSALETIIRKLCIECPRRGTVCREDLPTYIDAYRCKYDEAERVLRDMDSLFQGVNNEQ